MAEIYYIQNVKQYLRLLTRLIRNCEYEDIGDYGIFGCDLTEVVEDCRECELEECKLLNSLDNSDIVNHIMLDEEILNKLPGILVITDSQHRSERITLISVSEARDNYKYGIE